MPVVRVSLFDKAVAETQFENIMTSKEGLDIQDGHLNIMMYHIRPPTGGGRQTSDFGLVTKKFVEKKRCIIHIPNFVHPNCLPIAMMVGVEKILDHPKPSNFIQRKRKNYLERWSREVTEHCRVPLEGPLSVTNMDKLKIPRLQRF